MLLCKDSPTPFQWGLLFNKYKGRPLEADTRQAQSHSQASDRCRRQTADRSEITNSRQMEGTGRKTENSNLSGSLLVKIIQENMDNFYSLMQHQDILEAPGLSLV